MTTYMLWRDSDPNTDLAHKVKCAAVYYRENYGRKAVVCLVHPAALSGKKRRRIDGIAVKGDRFVRPHEFLIGFEWSK